MARILLIDPCGWQGGVNSDNTFPNIGIAYLTAAMRAAGHEVYIADMNNESTSNLEIVQLMRAERIGIVGISVKTATMGAARRLGSFLKQQLECIVIVGGAHASLIAGGLEKESWIDYVFMGEAEETLPLFCEQLGNADNKNYAGVWKRGELSAIPVHIQNLDTLPFPEYSLFPEKVIDAVALNYPLITSRGCVFDCIYCSVPIISGKRFRKRSLENIIAELKFAIDRFGIIEFSIIDDAFNLDMGRAKEFCHLLIRHNVRLRWSCPNGLRADRVDDELAELMFRSGCYSVMLGVETGDPVVFAGICKGETLGDVGMGIRTFQKAGIQVGGYFLIGLPGDSIRSQHLSVELVKRYDIVGHFNMLIPYPGTRLWDWVGKNGRLLRDIEDGLHFSDSGYKVLPVFETDDFKGSERTKAYEMVHTQVGRYELLVPKSYSRWRHWLSKLMLVLRYDRWRILTVAKIYFRRITC